MKYENTYPDAFDLAIFGADAQMDHLDRVAAQEGDARRRLDRLRPHPRGYRPAGAEAIIVLRPTVTVGTMNARRRTRLGAA